MMCWLSKLLLGISVFAIALTGCGNIDESSAKPMDITSQMYEIDKTDNETILVKFRPLESTTTASIPNGVTIVLFLNAAVLLMLRYQTVLHMFLSRLSRTVIC